VDEERLRLEGFRKEREAVQDDLNTAYREAGRFHEVGDVMRYMAAVDREIQLSGERLKVLEAEADRRRAALVVAQRERRVVELVKERQFEEWKYGVAREEQKRVDDMAVRARDRALREEALEMEYARIAKDDA
jgi:flagellar export protein FliJ